MTKLFAESYATPDAYVAALVSDAAATKFAADYAGLSDCDALVLALPCGADAHAEMGFVVGQQKPAFVLLPPERPLTAPELMYALDGVFIVATIPELIARLRERPKIKKFYVASSWARTLNHGAVVAALRASGLMVFDYRDKGRRHSTPTSNPGEASMTNDLHDDPQRTLKRLYKFYRHTGSEQEEARRLAAQDFQQMRARSSGRSAEEVALFDVMESTVTEACTQAPWLVADPDFVRQTLELYWGALASGSVIEDAIAVITHEASK